MENKQQTTDDLEALLMFNDVSDGLKVLNDGGGTDKLDSLYGVK